MSAVTQDLFKMSIFGKNYRLTPSVFTVKYIKNPWNEKPCVSPT